MTLEELYKGIGGDYEKAIGRMMNETLVGRFIVKFLDDPSCPAALEAWKRGDEAAAFEAAHMAKGVCANLAIDSLASLTSDITEALRPGNDELRAATDVDALMAQLDKAYGQTVEAITAYARSTS